MRDRRKRFYGATDAGFAFPRSKKMRILISSDIHANILACEALAKIYAREKCDLHITLGDAVDLGPWPKKIKHWDVKWYRLVL